MRALLVVVALSSLLAAQANSDLKAVLQQGGRLVDSGQLAAAEELYKKALSSFPSDPDLRFELGMVYFRQQNWEKAAENYRASLSRGPRVKSLYYLAESYFMQSDLD